jgi:hypothetical protein
LGIVDNKRLSQWELTEPLELEIPRRIGTAANTGPCFTVHLSARIAAPGEAPEVCRWEFVDIGSDCSARRAHGTVLSNGWCVAFEANPAAAEAIHEGGDLLCKERLQETVPPHFSLDVSRQARPKHLPLLRYWRAILGNIQAGNYRILERRMPLHALDLLHVDRRPSFFVTRRTLQMASFRRIKNLGSLQRLEFVDLFDKERHLPSERSDGVKLHLVRDAAI